MEGLDTLSVKKYDKDGNEILRTPNLSCPCCQAGSRHENMAQGDRILYHPLMGTGVDNFRKRRSEDK